MIWVDYLVVGIILISAGISIVRGFIKEVLSLISWIVSFWVALVFHPHLATPTPAIIATTAYAPLQRLCNCSTALNKSFG